MTKTLTKAVLAATVLIAVAAVSYRAGAAKAKAAVVTPAAEIKWEPLGPNMPLQIARLWGDRDKGPEYGMLLKLPPGFDSGMHSHTGDYQATLVQGTWVHTVEGEAGPAKDLAPGSYVFQPGKQNHSDACKSKTDCIIFVHQHAKGDFIPAKTAAKPADKPADKAPAPAAAPADKKAPDKK